MSDVGLHRLQGLASADFVIEAVRESEDIKRSVFMRLDQVTQPAWRGHTYCLRQCGHELITSRENAVRKGLRVA